MTRLVEKTQGVCLNQAFVFFTDSESGLFAAPKDMGDQTNEQGRMLTNALAQPRGCVWDQDGTIYIADGGNNRIASIASSFASLSEASNSLAVTSLKLDELEDPYDVAIIQIKVAAPSILGSFFR